MIPTFGDGVIRMFSNNTSEMKRLAARDFEDILQCAIPAFEGLFPDDHDAIVQSLLYRFAQWHALAKLRIHSESTLGLFDKTFKDLSKRLRKFRDFTCAAFDTLELPKEKAARQRRFAQRETNNVFSESSGPRVKKFNLSTYKFHAMGDYVRSIRLFGTTDSYTTQIGELAHRALKAFYPLTSKLDTPAQLAKHERRRRILRRVREAAGISPSDNPSPADSPAPSSSRNHHLIAATRNNPVSLFTFLREHDGDPAIKNFIPKLKDHVLYRLKKLDVSHCDRTFTDGERNSVIIPNNTVYSVQTMQVHYSTYDMRREYDTVRVHSDVMVLSGETSPSHPYWYARVLGIYHMDTWLEGAGRTKKQQLEVLHVRWLAPFISSDYQSGMQRARLPKVAFVEESDQDAFGFLDPGQLIRRAHLIPAFSSKRGSSSLRYGKSLARPMEELDDWEEHYVGIFADRDMFLRYTHLGVGHPVALRKIARDCFCDGSTTPTEAMDVDTDASDHEGHEDEDIDVNIREEGSEHECEEEDDDMEGSDEEIDDIEERDEAEEVFDDLSF